MMNTINENLSKRDTERLISQFIVSTQYTINFIKLSSETGVIRNGGRRGSKYGPSAILNLFKKLAIKNEKHHFHELELSDSKLELHDFKNAQESEEEKIFKSIKTANSKKFVLLGGGHDHIFPLLMSLNKMHPTKKIIILNLDPHMDTRIDPFHSSGTPFRQFDLATNRHHKIIQVGTHGFANVASSKSNLSHLEQKIISFDELKNATENFTNNEHFLKTLIPDHNQENCIYVLSLDADAIESGTMEGVSAVNHQGLPAQFIADVFDYFNHNLNAVYYGIFEYNPIFDNLSQKGARFLASLIYRLLD